MPPRARHRQARARTTTLASASILRYGHRLRYHLAPDLRLTSRGASLVARRHLLDFYSPSAAPAVDDFPCITAAVSHTSRVVESSALAANHPPCLSSRFRGLGGLANQTLHASPPGHLTGQWYPCKPTTSTTFMARPQRAVPMLRYPSECLASHPCDLHEAN